MPLRGYLLRVALEVGLTLACALPFVLIAVWHSCTRRWRLLLFIAFLVVLDLGLVEIPRVEWRLADVEFGWGLIISAILFAGFNGLVAVDSELHARLVPHAAIAPFMLSLVSGWIRERTDNVWPSVFGHNLSNIVIPLASLFS